MAEIAIGFAQEEHWGGYQDRAVQLATRYAVGEKD